MTNWWFVQENHDLQDAEGVYSFTGLDYWTELFSCFNKFLCLFLEISLQSSITWLLWMTSHNNNRFTAVFSAVHIYTEAMLWSFNKQELYMCKLSIHMCQVLVNFTSGVVEPRVQSMPPTIYG